MTTDTPLPPEVRDMLNVTVYDGKYTVIQDEKGRLRALRYGEEWRDCVGDGLICALGYEVHELRTRIKELEDRISWALRVNASGMEGFTTRMLRGNLDDLDYQLGSYTLREYVEAVEKEDREEQENNEFKYCDAWPCDAGKKCACYQHSIKHERENV